MAGITLAQAQAKLDLWMDAEDKVATGQSYTISTAGGSRTLTRADLGEIRRNIDYWDQKVRRLSGGGIRVRHARPATGR